MRVDYPPERLRMLRKRALLTQADVCELLGLGKNTLPNWERGKFKPQSSKLERVLNLYAIRIQRNEKLNVMLGGEGR